MITFLHQGSFILISSDSGQHVRHPPCFIHPLTMSFDKTGLYSWAFVKLWGKYYIRAENMAEDL